jgi:hypothetical protein
MKRREFIIISGAGIASASIPVLTGCESRSRWTSTLAMPRSIGQLIDEKSLFEIGADYLSKFPDESSDLENLLLKDVSGHEFSPDSEQTLIKVLDDKIQADFKSHDTVVVKGWVLARTEARQCGLYSLTTSR